MSGDNLNFCDKVIVLDEYRLYRGLVIRVNKKSINVSVNGVSKLYKYCKVLKYGTKAVLVWESWKGTNGRGSYRIETILYQALAINIEDIRPCCYLHEDNLGSITDISRNRYLNSIRGLPPFPTLL
jgi:hypothetical protein